MSARHPEKSRCNQIFASIPKVEEGRRTNEGSYIWVFVVLFPPNLKARFSYYYLSVLHKIRPNIIQDNLHGEAGAW
jgi:hypothetical protein